MRDEKALMKNKKYNFMLDYFSLHIFYGEYLYYIKKKYF
jgi:hypothetical protein